jgi:hypothetical protein
MAKLLDSRIKRRKPGYFAPTGVSPSIVYHSESLLWTQLGIDPEGLGEHMAPHSRGR